MDQITLQSQTGHTVSFFDDATATAELLQKQYVLDTVFPSNVVNQAGLRKALVIELYQVVG